MSLLKLTHMYLLLSVAAKELRLAGERTFGLRTEKWGQKEGAVWTLLRL